MQTISVIIPTYNRAGLLTRAINSVLRQTRKADEIIVVDDGSTDETSNIITRDYPQVRLLQQANQGVSAARNAGIRTATGDWIALLDSDDMWLEEKLQQQIAALRANPDYRVCHTDEFWIRNSVAVNPMKKHRKRGGDIFRYCLPRCAMSPSSIMIHRSVFRETGLFDESLPACEDYDLWLRICARYPVLYIDKKLLTKYGGHADQLSRRYWGLDRFRIHALARLLETETLLEKARTATINTLLEKIHIYLQGARKHGNTECVDTFTRLQNKYSAFRHNEATIDA